MTSVTPQSWAVALLGKLGAPVTKNNLISVLAWEEAEGGQWHNTAHWNPLNTTLDNAKYGAINSDGVATYPNYETGLNETVRTLQEPRYAAVVHDLKTSAPPSTTTGAVALSPWGTWKDGSSPGPNVATATTQVDQNPQWLKQGTSPTKPTHGHQKPTHHTPGHHTSPAHDKKGHHAPPNPGAPGSKHDKIVLDIAELARLDSSFAQSSQQISGIRSQVMSLQDELGPALTALKDQSLASWIRGMFGWITEPLNCLDSSARQCDDISVYCGQIRTLAQDADAGNGATGPAAVKKFIAAHPKPKHDAQGWEAVVAALGGGAIYRKNPPTSTGSGAPGSSGSPGGSSTRTQRADNVIDLGATQTGTHETGVNLTKYGAWYGDNGVPWCGIYVSWVFAHAGTPLPAINGPHGFDSVDSAIAYASAHHQLDAKPQVGDVFLYKNGDHTGIVTKVYPDGSFQTSEGNWSNQVVSQRRTNNGTYDFWNPYPSS